MNRFKNFVIVVTAPVWMIAALLLVACVYLWARIGALVEKRQ